MRLIGSLRGSATGPWCCRKSQVRRSDGEHRRLVSNDHVTAEHQVERPSHTDPCTIAMIGPGRFARHGSAPREGRCRPADRAGPRKLGDIAARGPHSHPSAARSTTARTSWDRRLSRAATMPFANSPLKALRRCCRRGDDSNSSGDRACQLAAAKPQSGRISTGRLVSVSGAR